MTVPGGLAAGTHNLSVAYSGDSNYASSSATLNPITSTVHLQNVSIGLSWPTPTSGQAWTLTATLNGLLVANTPRTGTLSLSVAGNTLASINLATATPISGTSYALVVPNGLPLGTDVVTVSYSGDSNYASATSAVTLRVTNDTLSVSYSTQVLSGQAYTVNAAINGALVNSTPCTGTLSLMEGTNTLTSVNVAMVQLQPRAGTMP